MKKLILFCLALLPLCLIAEPNALEDRVVSFDEVIVPEDKLVFGEELHAIRPQLSEFEIEYYRFLSNDLGARFALVTFTNQKAGLRRISERDVVGVLVNGQRLYPIRLEGKTQLGARGSVLLHFGRHPFPLARLETRTD